MNIFNKIGNNIEEKKKQSKISRDKYWKLSASERMDYDNKLEKINDSQSFLIFTSTLIKAIFWIAAFFYLMSLYMGRIILESAMPLISQLILLIPLLLFVDTIYLLLKMDSGNRRKKQLNKRFKLK